MFQECCAEFAPNLCCTLLRGGNLKNLTASPPTETPSEYSLKDLYWTQNKYSPFSSRHLPFDDTEYKISI